MSVDTSMFNKITGGSNTLPQTLEPDQWMIVLVKTHTSDRPNYLTVRTEISAHIFSAEIQADRLLHLEADVNVQSFSISQPIAAVKVKVKVKV